jgi:VCBS repeat-containing protein
VITPDTPIERVENNLYTYTGYASPWDNENTYSVISQSEMLSHLDIVDPDNTNFTVTLSGATVGWHGGLESTNSHFTSSSGALQSGSDNYDETVIQITQDFLDNYPQVAANGAQIGDFYFDHVDFDKLAKGDTATITFDVLVTDANGGVSNPTTMTVTVNGSNDQPLAIDHMDTYEEDTIVAGNVSGKTNLLDGASDVDTNDVLDIGKVNGDASKVGQPQNVTFIYTNKDGVDTPVLVKVTIDANGDYRIAQTDLDAIPEGSVATGTIKYTVKDDNNIDPATSTDETSFADEKTLTIKINGNNDAPLLDLDADNSSQETGADYQTTFKEGSGGVAIADTDTLVTDIDSANLQEATITLTNAKTGDTFDLSGVDAKFNATLNGNVVTLSGDYSIGDYESAIEAVKFNNTSATPDQTD